MRFHLDGVLGEAGRSANFALLPTGRRMHHRRRHQGQGPESQRHQRTLRYHSLLLRGYIWTGLTVSRVPHGQGKMTNKKIETEREREWQTNIHIQRD